MHGKNWHEELLCSTGLAEQFVADTNNLPVVIAIHIDLFNCNYYFFFLQFLVGDLPDMYLINTAIYVFPWYF
jgi:hypothetical protein